MDEVCKAHMRRQYETRIDTGDEAIPMHNTVANTLNIAADTGI